MNHDTNGIINNNNNNSDTDEGRPIATSGTQDGSLDVQQHCWQRLRAVGLSAKDKPQHVQLKKRASVLVLLFVDQDDNNNNNKGNDNDTTISTRLCTFITKRSLQLRSHPGECCFPGGRQDAADAGDDVQTALREAQEEVGLHPDDVEILARLPTMESIHHLCVTPIVGKVKDSVVHRRYSSSSSSSSSFLRDYPWTINHDEVDSAFGVPMAFFLQDPVSLYKVQWSGETFAMRTYEYYDAQNDQTYAITGLTAHIVHQVASLAFGITELEPSPEAIIPNNNKRNDTEIFPGGYLWKREMSSRGRPYWIQKYFVPTSDGTGNHNKAPMMMLHQYDSKQAATRKSRTATKKNRLPLHDCHVKLDAQEASHATTNGISLSTNPTRYEFTLTALGGRIAWHLAAPSNEERSRWMNIITQVSAGY